jgi:ATP-dependent protease Clp ATPase subunit
MMDVFYDAPSHEELKEIVVTEEMIEKGVANVDDGDEFLRKSA